MQHSKRDTGPGFFPGAYNIDARYGVFNNIHDNQIMDNVVVSWSFIESISLIVQIGDRPMVCTFFLIDVPILLPADSISRQVTPRNESGT